MSFDLLTPTAASWPQGSSMTTSGRAQRLGIPLLISGFVLTGSPVGTTDVVQTHVIEHRPVADRTTAGGPPAPSQPAPATAEAVRRLRDRSGLTWEELARLFGVSRRAMHKWADGGRLNSHHTQLLGKLDAIVSDIDTGDRDRTRAVLMAVGDGRPSLYMTLRRRLQPAQRLVGPEPADLLAGRWDVTAPIGDVVPGKRLPKPPAER